MHQPVDAGLVVRGRLPKRPTIKAVFAQAAGAQAVLVPAAAAFRGREGFLATRPGRRVELQDA